MLDRLKTLAIVAVPVGAMAGVALFHMAMWSMAFTGVFV